MISLVVWIILGRATRSCKGGRLDIWQQCLEEKRKDQCLKVPSGRCKRGCGRRGKERSKNCPQDGSGMERVATGARELYSLSCSSDWSSGAGNMPLGILVGGPLKTLENSFISPPIKDHKSIVKGQLKTTSKQKADSLVFFSESYFCEGEGSSSGLHLKSRQMRSDPIKYMAW